MNSRPPMYSGGGDSVANFSRGGNSINPGQQPPPQQQQQQRRPVGPPNFPMVCSRCRNGLQALVTISGCYCVFCEGKIFKWKR